MLTAGSIYQATVKAGLQRFGLEPQARPWVYSAGKRFLARWPHRVVVLRHDNRIALLRPETGEETTVLDFAGLELGVVNAWNDAAIVGSSRGRVYCIRPLGSKPLAAAEFKPAPPAPPAKPAGSDTAESVPEPAEEAEEIDTETPAE